jgi:hypothetical protein
VARTWFHESRMLSVDAFVGYIRSFSAYHTYKEQHPDRADPVDRLAAELAGVAGAGNTLAVEFPFFLICGSKLST